MDEIYTSHPIALKEDKPKFFRGKCWKCKSDWGYQWQVCQRCGNADSTPPWANKPKKVVPVDPALIGRIAIGLIVQSIAKKAIQGDNT
jgi:hypothetical protein